MMDTIVPTRYPESVRTLVLKEHWFDSVRMLCMANPVCRQMVTLFFQIPDLAVFAEATFQSFASGDWALTIFHEGSLSPIVIFGDESLSTCETMRRVLTSLGHPEALAAVAD